MSTLRAPNGASRSLSNAYLHSCSLQASCFFQRRHDGVSSRSTLWWLFADNLAVLSQDRTDEAYRAFVNTRADSTQDEQAMRLDFDVLHAHLIHEKQNAVKFIDLFKQPGLRKRCIIGWLTMFGAQGTATLVINSEYLSDAGEALLVAYQILRDRLWSLVVLITRLRYCPATFDSRRLDLRLSLWQSDQCSYCR